MKKNREQIAFTRELRQKQTEAERFHPHPTLSLQGRGILYEIMRKTIIIAQHCLDCNSRFRHIFEN
ncbi:MAG: hypothetical protein CO103_07030 [Chloroflexi bacterium CG_4_9_14_3_um_filter_45_9]|nr:MAG: hypothetical protein COT13_04675 [Chloroflexi bacterium CG08_land_8_20_14_0_20_45_12]PJB48726.1 MAG: hypothetical protein CO103_07030 [Chloroflexi bacterium CG_4_9_14_3_um_filter_45_9]